MSAMKAGDEDALAKLPENLFKVGTAEIKNRYPVIAAMNAAGLVMGGVTSSRRDHFEGALQCLLRGAFGFPRPHPHRL